MAKYAYLSDGMKSGAYHADGSGFIYRGSLKYARSSTGALTLVGAEIPSGMLTPGGPCYTVKDHLGSIVYEVNASTGAFADGAMYDEWGGREALAGVASSAVSCRHYTGKEDQWPDFSVPYTDFGARHYCPALRRWLTPDPLSEKYYTSSPYAYCAGDPVNLVDPDGNSWYFDIDTGDFYCHIKDDDDNIYMISAEQNATASQSRNQRKYYRSLRSDDNMFGALSNSLSNGVSNNVFSFFYNQANTTKEGGNDFFFSDGKETQFIIKPAKGKFNTLLANQKQIIVDEDSRFYKGYYIILLLSHEIQHQLDITDGTLTSSTYNNNQSYFELRADLFAKKHWSFKKTKEGREDINQHIRQISK